MNGEDVRGTGRKMLVPATRPRDAELPEAELRGALKDALIQALYQPIVRLHDGRPMGMEVLARLEHPSHGMMSPENFVPPMEDAGLAWPLTAAVMRRAFADWSGPRLDSLDLTLALNLPLDVLLVPEALAILDRERAAAGIAAARVVIELTESQPVIQLSEIRAAVIYLRGLGYGLAIDDVGPAIRDHTPLLDMSFTSLKLDKDLVQQAPHDPDIEAFLRRAIASAKSKGLKNRRRGDRGRGNLGAYAAARGRLRARLPGRPSDDRAGGPALAPRLVRPAPQQSRHSAEQRSVLPPKFAILHGARRG